MDEPSAGRNKHQALLARDGHLSHLWDKLQLARCGYMTTNDKVSIRERTDRLRRAAHAVDVCLGYLKWKQRRWLRGGVMAIKTMDATEQIRQRQEGCLFRDVLTEKARILTELQGSKPDKDFHGSKSAGGSGSIVNRTASPAQALEGNVQHGSSETLPLQTRRLETRRASKPRYRWLKNGAIPQGVHDDHTRMSTGSVKGRYVSAPRLKLAIH